MHKHLLLPLGTKWSAMASRLKKSRANLLLAACLAAGTLSAFETKAQTVTSEDFETGGATWTIVNGTQVNKWFVGPVTAAAGANSAYISDDAAGATNNYLITTSSTTHIYKDVVFPAGQTDFQLTFKWKAQGDGTTDLDNLKVFSSLPTATVTAGTAMPAADRIGATWYNLSGVYTTATISFPPTYAGTTRRIVFSWKNNATLGTQPPASIDDILITSRAAVPLSGIYTIDKTLPTAGTNFASFTDAVNKLNIEGISGPVTFNVIAGQNFIETPPVITATGTVANPIIFQKSGTGTNPKITAGGAAVSTTLDGIIVLAGSDYMTFDGIDLEDPATNTTSATRMEFGYALLRASNTDGAQFNTIKNSTITLQKAYTSSNGIYSSNHTPISTSAVSATNATAAGTNSNNKIFGNTVTNVYIGIYFQGIATAAVYDMNNQIGVDGANNITNFGGGSSTSYGIYGISQDNFKVANNIVNGGTGTTTTLYGISLSTATNANAEIFNNTVTIASSATTSSVYGISNAAGGTGTNNLVKIYNNTVQNSTYSTSTSGQFHGIYNSATVFDLEIYGNTVKAISKTGTGTSYGIYNVANTVNNESIYNNNVFDFTSTGTGTWYGIYSNPSTTTKVAIYGNSVRDFNVGSTALYGIAAASTLSTNIYNNNVFNLSATAAGSTTFGIHTTSGITVNVYNNFISDLKAPAATGTDAIRGISIANTTSTHNIGVFYNTIYLNASSSSTTTFGSSGIFASSTPTVDLRNNIIVNVSTPGATGGVTAAYRRSTTTLTTYSANSNTNLFYAGVPSATQVIFTDGTNLDQTLGAYKTRVSPRDAGSVSGMPPFMNTTTAPYDLHINPAIATQVEGTATPVTAPVAITLDIDGNTRNTTTPDMGADEGNFIPQDLTPPSIAYTPLSNTLNLTGDRTFNATIGDASGVYITGPFIPRVYYRKNNDPYISKPGVFVSGTTASSVWTFTIAGADLGTLVPGDIISYYVIAQDMANPDIVGSSPGGVVATDVNTVITHPAVPNKYYIQIPYTGILNVGSTETITSLTNTGGLFDILNNNALGGNLTINITSDLTAETGLIGLNQMLEVGAGNYTLTIVPSAAVNRTISGSFAGGLIRLNGTDRVTIDGNFGGAGRFFTFANTNSTATNTAAIQVISLGAGLGAINNTIKNTTIIGGSNSVTSAFGIHAGAATISTSGTGADNNSLTIDNNVVKNAYYAIYARGVATTGHLTGLNINNNQIGSATAAEFVTFNGINIQNTTAPVISGNTIFNLQLATAVSNAAIDLGQNNTDAMVTRNTITGLRSTSTSGYGSYGINISSATGNSNITIANNMISDIITDGDGTSTTFNPFGIRITGGTNIKVYYNSVNLFGALTNLTTVDLSAALMVTVSTATGLDVRNNIFANSITGGAGTKSYSVYAVTGTTFGTINNNNYYVSGPNAVFGFLSADKANLAAWQTATTQDANSVSINPEFITPTNLHIQSGNLALNNTGTPIAAVTTDFDNETRSATTPDIGADEFSPAPLDLSASALVLPVQKACFSNAEQVTITVRNSGLNAIDFTATPATVTVNVTGAVTQTLVATLNNNTLNNGTPLAPGAFLNVPVGTLDMTAVGVYTINATTAITSGGTDGNATNNAIVPVTRTVEALVAGTATASQTVLCQSGTTTLNLAGFTGGDVKWQSSTSATGPFADIAGAVGSTYTLAAPITQTTYYQGIVFCGTNTIASNVVTVTVNSPTVSSVLGASRCGAGAVTLTATPSTGATVNWYTTATGGTAIATGNTYSPNVTATTTYYAEAGLGSNSYSVGAATNAIGAGGNSGTIIYYQIFDVLSPLTLQSVYVYPAAAGNVILHLSNSAGTVLQTFTIPVTAANVGQKTLVPINYSLTTGTGYRLGWYTGGVDLYRNTAGATYPFTVPGVISITGNSFTSGPNYWYYVYDFQVTTGCASARQAVVATVNPIPVVALGANVTNCGSATLNAGNAGASYTWSLNNTPITGATAQTLSATASGTYIAYVTSAAGCASSDTIQVTIDPLPVKPTVTAGGTTTFCQGGSVVLTGASTTTGVTYAWLLNNAPITGATAATYTANANGNYRVVAINTNGCTDTSTVTAVTVNVIPVTPTITAAGGSTTICQGSSVVLTAASTTTGATYVWSLNGTVIPSATSATYTANAAGNYTVVASASGCPSAASAATAITVTATPATPTISQVGGNLSSSATTGNQWYLNGTIIPGATGQTHVTTVNGNYTVVVTTSGCPSAASAVKTVTNTGIADNLAGMSVDVYPNPASGSFNVKLQGYQKVATVVLYNLAGQQITVEKVAADGNAKNFDIKGLAAGTYLLKITSDKGVQVNRLIVQ